MKRYLPLLIITFSTIFASKVHAQGGTTTPGTTCMFETTLKQNPNSPNTFDYYLRLRDSTLLPLYYDQDSVVQLGSKSFAVNYITHLTQSESDSIGYPNYNPAPNYISFAFAVRDSSIYTNFNINSIKLINPVYQDSIFISNTDSVLVNELNGKTYKIFQYTFIDNSIDPSLNTFYPNDTLFAGQEIKIAEIEVSNPDKTPSISDLGILNFIKFEYNEDSTSQTTQVYGNLLGTNGFKIGVVDTLDGVAKDTVYLEQVNNLLFSNTYNTQPMDSLAQYPVPLLGCISNSLDYISTDVLPLKLLSFDLQKSGADVLLKWKLAQSNNGEIVQIEKSVDGYSFTKISEDIARNGSNNFNDYNALQSNLDHKLFYRLKILQSDRSYFYSPIRMIQNQNAENNIAIAPNPASNFLKINIENPTSDAVSISVINSIGQRILFKKANVTNGNIVMPINQLSNGIYHCVITFSNGENVSKIFVVKK